MAAYDETFSMSMEVELQSEYEFIVCPDDRPEAGGEMIRSGGNSVRRRVGLSTCRCRQAQGKTILRSFL